MYNEKFTYITIYKKRDLGLNIFEICLSFEHLLRIFFMRDQIMCFCTVEHSGVRMELQSLSQCQNVNPITKSHQSRGEGRFPSDIMFFFGGGRVQKLK